MTHAVPETSGNPGQYHRHRIMPVVHLALLLSVSTVLAGPSWSSYQKQNDDWYRSIKGKQVADNILSWQSSSGSWPKNMDTTAKAYSGDRKKLKGTFDNSATTSELRFLTRAWTATKQKKYRQAFDKGLTHILKAQYPNGGWPQYYPPGKGYHRHITFNDNSMVRLMIFLRDVANTSKFAFIDDAQKQTAYSAFDLGIQCILKCQIKVDGKLTAWCAQHDEIDLRPRIARSYELESLSGAESAEILRLLMSIKKPAPQVVRSIEAGAQWFASVKITGIRQHKVKGDIRIIKDAKASPLWARFYEIPNNRPFFCGRDGVRKYDIAQIESERRNGYSWYGNWGQRVAKDYANWKKK
jgi:PelA/Pel-15E family pectate lyase